MALVAREAMSLGYKPKYSLLNYEQMKFDENGDVSRLHLEVRHMDGSLSPAAIAAQTVLLYGLMLKAVEISRHGILYSGSKEYMNRQEEIMRALCNGDGDWGPERRSNTSNLQPYISELQENAAQLVRLVKNTLVEQAPADDILKSLAHQPISMHRVDGRDWEQIEKELYPGGRESNEVKSNIQALLDTASIIECENGSEWMDEAAREVSAVLGNDDSEEAVKSCRTEIEKHITDELLGGRVFWSQEIGGYAARR